MKLEDGDVVIYEEPAYFVDEEHEENNISNVKIGIIKIKKVTNDGTEFIDEHGVVMYNYRVKEIFRNGERIENSSYDPIKIREDYATIRSEKGEVFNVNPRRNSL